MININCYAGLPESDAFLFEIHSCTITSMEKATCSYTSEQIDPEFALISCFKTCSEQLSRNWVTHEDFIHSKRSWTLVCPERVNLFFADVPTRSARVQTTDPTAQNKRKEGGGTCGNEILWTHPKNLWKKHGKVNTKVQKKTQEKLGINESLIF